LSASFGRLERRHAKVESHVFSFSRSHRFPLLIEFDVNIKLPMQKKLLIRIVGLRIAVLSFRFE